MEESQLRAPRRAEGTRAGLRILSAARDQLTRDRTVNVNALIGLLRAYDLGIDARNPLVPAQIAMFTRWRERQLGRIQDGSAAKLPSPHWQVNPLPASSGNTVRHRLNRGGDRRLNRALHTITMTRMAHDPGTRDYVAKRTQEGRSYREIRRPLKRTTKFSGPPRKPSSGDWQGGGLLLRFQRGGRSRWAGHDCGNNFVRDTSHVPLQHRQDAQV